MKTPPVRMGALVLAVTLGAMASGLAQNYTVNFQNKSGLDPTKFTPYVLGVSNSSGLVLAGNGTFVPQASGNVTSYPIGTGAGQMSSITLNASQSLIGGRFYVFMVPAGQPAPQVPVGQQPANPPDPSYPPYTIVEMTVPAPNPGPLPATFDVQTVDGFVFPLTITASALTDNSSRQYGQPLYASNQNPVVNRAAILSAYTTFMDAEGAAGADYLDLVYSSNATASLGQAGGILNPGAYLTTVDSLNAFVNLGSPLNAVWDDDVDTLFNSGNLSLQGVASNPPGIATDTYNATVTTQTYPGTSVTLPALKFTGATNGQTYYVFNPSGVTLTTDDNGAAITGTINGTSMVLNGPVSDLAGDTYYVAGAGVSQTNGNYTVTTSNVVVGTSNTTLTLSQDLGNPAGNQTYMFCRLPYPSLFLSASQMVFANSGFFADSALQFPPTSNSNNQSASVLGNLQNQIVSALNRGVALNAQAVNPNFAGGTSAVWGNQTYWYPSGATQNMFSLFMHTGRVGTTPIFLQPTNAAQWPNARGDTMGAAYGFAYDENGGPVPPAPSGQPEVPSKFDQNIAVGATLTITLGPWAGVSAPSIRVLGKSVIRTRAARVVIRGEAVGSEVILRYSPNGRPVTRKIPISGGRWSHVLQPVKMGANVLRFTAQNAIGQQSRPAVVRVIRN